jgi:hypothetical protein
MKMNLAAQVMSSNVAAAFSALVTTGKFEVEIKKYLK